MTTEKQILPSEVTLSDGRVARKKPAKMKDLVAAGQWPKKQKHLAHYATIACKCSIDNKPCVYEDLLDLYEEDFLLLMSMFVSDAEMEAAEKKAAKAKDDDDDNDDDDEKNA